MITYKYICIYIFIGIMIGLYKINRKSQYIIILIMLKLQVTRNALNHNHPITIKSKICTNKYKPIILSLEQAGILGKRGLSEDIKFINFKFI
jgi:hypothetical protein